MSLTPADWSALLAYSQGEAAPDEEDRVRTLLLTTPVAQRVLDELRAVQAGYAAAQRPVDSVAAFAAVRARLLGDMQDNSERLKDISQLTRATRPIRRVSRWPVRSGLGVGIVAMALAAGLYWMRGRTMGPSESEIPRTYTSQRGQIANITLPSGTRIQLAPLSRLTMTSDGATLDGEAVFNIVHRPTRPFVVRARNANIRVLGTHFVARAYAEESSVLVAVAEGKVAVNSVVLAHGDLTHVGISGETEPVRHNVQTLRFMEWTEGNLYFENTPLRDVATRLSRWYNVDFVLADQGVGRLLVTTIIKKSDPIDTVMHIIALSTNTSLERHADTVVISKPKAAAHANELPAPSRYATSGAPHTN